MQPGLSRAVPLAILGFLIGTGILMLVTFGGFGIWVLIDLIMIAVGKFSDKQGLALAR